MAGKIKVIIDCIISQRSHGDPLLSSAAKIKLLLKGIDLNSYSLDSVDDPEVISKIVIIIADCLLQEPCHRLHQEWD